MTDLTRLGMTDLTRHDRPVPGMIDLYPVHEPIYPSMSPYTVLEPMYPCIKSCRGLYPGWCTQGGMDPGTCGYASNDPWIRDLTETIWLLAPVMLGTSEHVYSQDMALEPVSIQSLVCNDY